MTNRIPDSMLAVCLSDDKLITRSVPVPRPSKGEVLIKIACAPVNPSDMARVKNLPASAKKNFIAGIEGSGTVVAHGKGLLPALWMGKRVSCSSVHSSSGTWAEYLVTGAAACVPLPSAINDEQGSMMLVNPLTAAAFISIAKKGNHKAIINTAASGTLGRMIELLAYRHKIPLIQVVKTGRHMQALNTHGTGYVIDSSMERFEADLHAAAVKLGATLAFDAVGDELTQKLLLSMPYGSTVIVYGNLSNEQPRLDHRSLVSEHKTVKGFYLVNWLKENGILKSLKCILTARNMLNGQISIPVQDRFGLFEVQKAVDTYLANMSKGKVLLVPSISR